MRLKDALSPAGKAEWQRAGFALPRFDREAARARTLSAPGWIHFGAGNIFRAFPAMAQQALLDRALCDYGIVVAEGFDPEIIDAVFTPHDSLSVAVTLTADGGMDKAVVGSVVDSLKMDAQGMARLRTLFAAPSLQLASFTITEKGYSLRGADGRLFPAVERDFAAGPGQAGSYMGMVAALCLHRYRSGGAAPLALVSMDNCSHNGDKLRDAVRGYAQAWAENGLADRGFLAYLDDGDKVSFPWSMIDKITPRPDEAVQRALEEAGMEDTQPVVTSKNTYVAPFVNAEETGYLVIEDHFPGGRPPLEQAGILFTDRETVDKVERMKVCTCLNPLHTALAVFGCLLGHTKISQEMLDADLDKLVRVVGLKEGLPVVVDPGILSPEEFIRQVLSARFPNPFLPDTPQRIAMDTSQKLPIRFGETIKAYLASDSLRVEDLEAIPLVLAAWCRYLLGVDDEGKPFPCSPDPLLEELQAQLEGITPGWSGDVHGALAPILSNPALFGVNLYDSVLGSKAEGYFARMLTGPGAVRATLQDCLSRITL